jgi:hypothetical protein
MPPVRRGKGRAGHVEPRREVAPAVVMDAEGRVLRSVPGEAWRRYAKPPLKGRTGGTLYRRALIAEACERYRAKKKAGLV